MRQSFARLTPPAPDVAPNTPLAVPTKVDPKGHFQPNRFYRSLLA
jgi:hypothetical protein